MAANNNTPAAPTLPAGVTLDENGRAIIPLSVPAESGQDRVTELRMRRAKAKDIRPLPAEGETVGDMIDLAGRLCGQERRIMDEIDVADLALVFDTVSFFMPAGLATGGKR